MASVHAHRGHCAISMIVHALLQLELATQGHQGILVADLDTSDTAVGRSSLDAHRVALKNSLIRAVVGNLAYADGIWDTGSFGTGCSAIRIRRQQRTVAISAQRAWCTAAPDLVDRFAIQNPTP